MYFDAAASTPLHPEVVIAMDKVRDVYANPFSKHAHGHKAAKIMDQCLKTMAGILNVSPDQLVITHGGTDGNRKVIAELQKRFGSENIYSSNVEHTSILDEFDPQHTFPPNEVDIIPSYTKGISLMHANNETGRIYDIAKIRQNNPEALLLQDWVQGVGFDPIDLSTVDFATFSAHKFYGPKGVGLLYIKNPEHFVKLSKDSHTKDIITIVGMTKAFELLKDKDIDKIIRWTNKIETFLQTTFPDCFIHESDKTRIPGIINVAFKDVRGSELMSLLSQKEGVSVSTGSACQSDIMSPTHVIKAIQSDSSYQYPIRISLHQFLTDEDVNDLCGILEEYVSH